MRRSWWLALVIGCAAVAAFLWLRGSPRLPGADPVEDPYRPLELPADVQGRLVVWDHPWPHANPIANPDRFLGERPVTWEQRLAAAVEAFNQRFPSVEVVVEVRPFAADRSDAAAAETSDAPAAQASPDVLALWWGGPMPPSDRLVPLNPYLSESVMAMYHAAAWPLVEVDGIYLGWPRWIALHYWLAPDRPGVDGQDGPGGGESDVDAAGVMRDGWSFDAAAAATGAGLLVPPAEPGLLLELAAGRTAPPDPLVDEEAGAAAGTGPDQPPADPEREAPTDQPPADPERAAAVARLIGVLETLRNRLTGSDLDTTVGRRLTSGEFGLAAGFGPALGHWAVSQPLSGRGRPGDLRLDLLPPPVIEGEPTRVPVLSAGAYAVLRQYGPDERVRAQLAMELARHLSAWQAEAAVARLLAVPAYRASLQRWQSDPPLAPAAAQRLVDDAAYAASFGLRVYGRPDPAAPPLDPAMARDWWLAWRSGDLDDAGLALRLLGAADAEAAGAAGEAAAARR